MGMQASDNTILARLVRNDQREREHFFDHPDAVTRHDKTRRAKAALLLRNGLVRTARDYLHAALLYQHGLTIVDYRKAQRFARLAILKGGGTDAKWFYAITTDRLLTRQGRKQKFGTQWNILRELDPKTGKVRRVLRLIPVDRRVSDKERMAYGIRPLKELLEEDGLPAARKQKTISFD